MRVSSDGTRELIIPLASDMAFFQLLYTALQHLTSHLHVVRQDFISNIERLASTISRTARPQSAICRDFHPSSSSSDPSSISSPLLPLVSPFSSSFIPGGKSKSDLYAWREIFQLYVEAEVFESLSERDRGERDIVETERRLALFAEQVTGRGLSDTRKLKLKESRDALETFLQLNVLILNLKKVIILLSPPCSFLLTLGYYSSSLPTLKLREKSSRNTLNVRLYIYQTPIPNPKHLFSVTNN